MFPEISADERFRCKERSHRNDPPEKANPVQKKDHSLEGLIKRAIWSDEVLRAIEYYEVDIRVRDQVLYLSGHIANLASLRRIESAIRSVPGLQGVRNYLVQDDTLIMDVSRSLGALEHRYGCKFFTGASHGVVSLSGIVSDKKVKLLAEKCAAANPDVRAVANHVRIAGAAPEALDPQPVLQPSIGQKIYFVDGIFGTIQQVVIDPDNRRVTAMTLSGQFGEPQESGSLHGNADPRERCIVIGMPLVRHLTSTSGFLNIRSDRSELYSEFDNASFFTPGADWTPPYPYCSLEVLFPSQHQPEEDPIPQAVPGQASTNRSQEQLQWEELLASESLGG